MSERNPDMKQREHKHERTGLNSPSPSFALLIGNCDVIALVENIQQGPRGEKQRVMNKVT